MVGDTPYDAQAAAALKVNSIGVLSGGWEGSRLLEAGCEAVFRGPADLFARYDQSPIAARLQKAA